MVNSLVWTAEEAKYLKAIFHWQDRTSASDDEKRLQEDEQQQQNAPQESTDEIRVLVIGGRGTGKTAILTRFAQDSFLPAQSYAQGCRRTITLAASSTSSTTAAAAAAAVSTTPATQTDTPSLQPPIRPAPSPPTQRVQPTQRQSRSQSHPQPQPPQPRQPLLPPRKSSLTLTLNITEFPWQHLPSNPHLGQALRATDAAVLVYSVRDRSSLRLAAGLAEFVGEYFTTPYPYPPLTATGMEAEEPRATERVGKGDGKGDVNGNGVSSLMPSRPDSGWGSTPSSVTGLGIGSGLRLRSRWGRGSTAGSAPASSGSGSGSGSAAATGTISTSAWVPSSRIHGDQRVGMENREGDGRGDADSGDRGRMYPVILVGNKCDADDDADANTVAALLGGSGRVVSWGEGAAAARVMRLPVPTSEVPFLEISARTGEGVDEIFRVVGEQVIKVRQLAQAREQADSKRMGKDGAGLAKPVAGEGSRKKTGFWRALSAVFGKRRAAEGR